MDFLAVLTVFLASSLGTPYHFGGNNPVEGYDCSGFVMEYMHMYGVGPKGDATSQAIHNYFMVRPDQQLGNWGYSPNTKAPPMGALVFFGRGPKQITHIGLMINSVQMAEAGGGTQSVLTEKQAADRNAYVKIRPYTRRKDIVAVIIPKYPVYSGYYKAVGMVCKGMNGLEIDCDY